MLGGPVDSVASDVAQIARIGDDMGLLLNTSKCELIGAKDLLVRNQLLQSFTRVEVNDANFLGTPMFHSQIDVMALLEQWID